jgi:hypothetical protein
MPRHAGTSRARRLNGVEPIPDRRSAGAEEPSPAVSSGASQPDSADPDLDGALAGMSLLLRLPLRLMKSSRAGGR